MALTKVQKSEIKSWVKGYFKENHAATTTQLWERFLEEKPNTLVRAVKKAGKKIGQKAYFGRCLISPISKEGWIMYKGKTWYRQNVHTHCAYCFHPLEDVYMIDNDGYYYCDYGCLEDRDACEPEDGYWDDYAALFADFEAVYPECQTYLRNHKKKKGDCEKLENLLEEIEEITSNPDYTTIYLNGGDDGMVAAEMYRMLTLLDETYEGLDRLKEEDR